MKVKDFCKLLMSIDPEAEVAITDFIGQPGPDGIPHVYIPLNEWFDVNSFEDQDGNGYVCISRNINQGNLPIERPEKRLIVYEETVHLPHKCVSRTAKEISGQEPTI